MCQYMYHLGKNSNNSGKPNPNTQAAELVHDFKKKRFVGWTQ